MAKYIIKEIKLAYAPANFDENLGDDYDDYDQFEYELLNHETPEQQLADIEYDFQQDIQRLEEELSKDPKDIASIQILKDELSDNLRDHLSASDVDPETGTSVLPRMSNELIEKIKSLINASENVIASDITQSHAKVHELILEAKQYAKKVIDALESFKDGIFSLELLSQSLNPSDRKEGMFLGDFISRIKKEWREYEHSIYSISSDEIDRDKARKLTDEVASIENDLNSWMEIIETGNEIFLRIQDLDNEGKDIYDYSVMNDIYFDIEQLRELFNAFNQDDSPYDERLEPYNG